MSEIVDGQKHPLAADLLNYLETMPYNNDRVKLRKRTIALLALHMTHGLKYESYLSYQMKAWRDGCLNRCKLGLMAEPLTLYWTDFRRILETDMLPPESGAVLPVPEPEPELRVWAKPERIVPLVITMTLNKGQRQRLLKLQTTEVFVRQGDDVAEAVWWHYLMQIGERMKLRMPVTIRGKSLLARFVAMQAKLLEAGALNDQQKAMWLLVSKYITT